MTVIDRSADVCAGSARCGEYDTYVSERCRGPACREANADYQRAYHAFGSGGRTPTPAIPPAALAWQKRGACAGHPDPDLWFPGPGMPHEPAKAICATCPVQVECLEHALILPEKHGIWGGKSERERERIARSRRRSRPKNGTV